MSTASDMAAYMRWLTDPADERVLNKASKQALFERQYAMAGGLTGIGYTWNRKARGDAT